METEGMNFELPEELVQMRDTLRRFVDREMIPIERQVRSTYKTDPKPIALLTEKAKALGLEGFDVPVEHGGMGLGLLAKTIVWSELARSIALPSRGGAILGPNISPILYALNPAQQEKYLRPTLAGKYRWCFMQTEPDAGADPSSMRTRAVREGDTAARLGGDEFAVLFEHTPPEMAETALRRLTRIADLAAIGPSKLHVGVSVGVAHFERAPAQSSDALAAADHAMYEAKAAGKGCLVSHLAESA